METVLVEVECIRSTAADIDYFERGYTYTIDMEWAKARGIWKYFNPLNEISAREAEERVRDEVIPKRDAVAEENRRLNEESERKLEEKKPEIVKSFPGIAAVKEDSIKSHSIAGTSGRPAPAIRKKTPAGIESHSRPSGRGKKK